MVLDVKGRAELTACPNLFDEESTYRDIQLISKSSGDR